MLLRFAITVAAHIAAATHCVTKQPYVCESLISDADAAKLSRAEGALEGVPTLEEALQSLPAAERAGRGALLEAALSRYPAVHAAQLKLFERGDANARVVHSSVFHGLGNREQALISAFALALATEAALLIDWGRRGCDGYAAGKVTDCDLYRFTDLFEPPPFNWRYHPPENLHIKKRTLGEKDVTLAIKHSATLADVVRGIAFESPDRLGLFVAMVQLRTDHYFLKRVMCHASMRTSRLFPDLPLVQARLEKYLLRPKDDILRLAKNAVRSAGGCAVGVHLRHHEAATTRRHDDAEAAAVFGRIRDELYDASKGGLFVAADGHSAWLRDRLHASAAAHNISIVARDGFGGQAAGDRGALADNYVLSRCAVLVQSRESTFFELAATRAAAKNDQVRAVWVCPRDDSVEDSKSHRRRRTRNGVGPRNPPRRQTAEQARVFSGRSPRCFVHDACNFTHTNATPATRLPLRENHEVVRFEPNDALRSCRPPARLPDKLLARLHFFALASCQNPHLLAAFRDFYEARGVDLASRARIVLTGCSGDHLEAARRVWDVCGDVVVESRTYSSTLKNELASDFLRSLPEGGLMMYADSDEFFDMDGSELLRRVEAYGGFVLGHMVDRIARDWTLRAYDGVGDIWDAYARRCPVTSQLLAGANTKWILVPKSIDGVPVRWLNSHYLNVEPLVARTYGAIPPSLPFSHYRFAERARRFGRHDRLAKHLHKVIDTSGPVPRLSDAAVSELECGAACS